MKANHNLNSGLQISFPSCSLWFKDTKMKANHNIIEDDLPIVSAVPYGSKILK